MNRKTIAKIERVVEKQLGWQPSDEYWQRTIANLKNAIVLTKQAMDGLTEQRQIDAHQAQINSQTKKLKETEEKYRQWRTTGTYSTTWRH